jgi:CRISPR-associated protein Csd2
MSLTNKIDFALVFTVKKANPNGDPLNGNRPRIDYEGYGEVSDVCLKRKLRNRLLDLGEHIFVQSDDNRKDDYRSLKDRFENTPGIKEVRSNREKLYAFVCKTWYDVRAFGQVFPFKAKKNKGEDEDVDAVSLGVRGPVSIQSAVSIEPVDIFSQQITKSVNLETDSKDPDKKGPDTMGMKHRVEYGIYVTYGSINCQLAEKTGFSDEDADKLLIALRSLFTNDESAARPSGCINVEQVVWWKHNSKSGQFSSATVHNSIDIKIDENKKKPYVVIKNPLEGLEPEIFSGNN